MGWQRGEAGAQRPFLLFCLLEGEQLWDSAGSSAALCSPPSPLCPVHVSQCLSPRVSWCEGRQAGEGRGWSAPGSRGTAPSQASPGSPHLPPALAAHVRAVLVPPVPGGPGHREIPVTGIRAAWPSAAPSSQAAAGCFQTDRRAVSTPFPVDKAMPKALSLLFLPGAAQPAAALLSAWSLLLRSSASRCRLLQAGCPASQMMA